MNKYASAKVDYGLPFCLSGIDENGEEESDEYVILKCSTDENGEDVLETIEDDDEFERIADIFDDEFADIFYDDQP